MNNIILYQTNEHIFLLFIGIPALEIFISTMESVNANKMFIPKTGLVDGMIKEIFNEKNGTKLNP